MPEFSADFTKLQKFEAIYNKYAQKIFTYFLFRVNFNRGIAEDLMQDTFYLAFKNFDRFEFRGESYLPYLLTVAHNLLVNYYKKKKALPLERAEEIPTEITADIVQKLELEKLWHAVEELPPIEKTALQFFYRENKSVAEIAKLLGKSENAVKLILSRARKNLREKLARE